MRKLIYSISILTILLASCSQKARLILLPDTQTYAEKYPEILDAQVDWILAHAKEIDFVLQQGDLTQNNSVKEWQIVKKAFQKLDNKVPYVLAVGNHDMGSRPGLYADVRNAMLFNQFFLYQDKVKEKHFGGSFEVGTLENSYYLFNTKGKKWLVITLEFGPRNEVLEWANQIVAKYPNRLAIINTHAYMYSDDTRIDDHDKWAPKSYGIGKDTGPKAANNGEQIWEKLINKNENIRFVFSGHILNSGVGNLISSNQSGLPVYQMLANYQEGVIGSVKGGNGFLRIIDMDFKLKKMTVQSYSPYVNEYKLAPAHQFTLNNIYYDATHK